MIREGLPLPDSFFLEINPSWCPRAYFPIPYNGDLEHCDYTHSYKA